jgi:hypothetical protein
MSSIRVWSIFAWLGVAVIKAASVTGFFLVVSWVFSCCFLVGRQIPFLGKFFRQANFIGVLKLNAKAFAALRYSQADENSTAKFCLSACRFVGHRPVCD